MSYRVVFNHPRIGKLFQKELESIPDSETQNEIMKQVKGLAVNPRPHGVVKIKPPVDIFSSLAQYRLKIGDYRVFYDIDDTRKAVSIIALRRRNDQTYR